MTARVLIVWDDGLAEHELETEGICEAVQRVGELDGQARTLVTVFCGDAHAAVGGDAATGLVVFVTFDGASFHQLAAGKSRSDDEVMVVAGGQSGSYSRRMVVSLEAATEALRAFGEDRILDPNQQWVTS